MFSYAALSESNDKFTLFSCGDGQVLQHFLSNVNQKAKRIEDFFPNYSDKTSNRTEIAWKPDWNYIAIGNEDGLVVYLSFDVFFSYYLRILLSLEYLG